MLTGKTALRFQDVASHLGALPVETAEGLISNAADIAIILDHKGVVCDLALSEANLPDDEFVAWIGQTWSDTVTIESRPKVQAAIDEALSTGVSKRREINHAGRTDSDFPFRYQVIQIPDHERLIAFGQDLRHTADLQQRLINAQLETEREYARLRQAESRYRLLFQMGIEAVLIVDSASGNVVEANAAASDIVGMASSKLVGRKFHHVFASTERETVLALLNSANAMGRTRPVTLKLSQEDHAVDISASVFRQGNHQYTLIRIAPNDPKLEPIITRDRLNTLKVMDALPDGFVVIDDDRQILEANTAFLDFIQVASLDQIRNQSIETWFDRPNVDFNVLVANLKEHGTVRRFPTVLRGAHGALEAVEIAAVTVNNENGNVYGLVIREVGAAQRTNLVADRFQNKSMEQLSDLIGHMSLKEVVRETTDVIERLCIEAALKMTNDNRASAAQMLGLSRQSLYAKLNRFGIGERADRSESG